jgi:ribosomal-protein-alanine N-acetyltransferase
MTQHDLQLMPVTPAQAAEIATWHYPDPFDFYDSSGDPTLYPAPDEQGLGYYALVDGDLQLLGFCCLGPEGRVPGQHDEVGTVDVGMGIRPDVVSRGLASEALPLVLALARARGARRLRTAVAEFNQRSLRLCRRAGFVEHRRFVGPGGHEFVELVRAT